MHYQLDGKVAVVTAAAQGIGRASARIMAESGAIVVMADLNEAKVRKTAADIVAAGGKAVAIAMDARQEDSVRAVISYAHRTYGRLDILHNNAGGSYPDRDRQAVDIDRDVWEDVFAWNMHGSHWACQAAIPHMIAGGSGSIINTVTAGAAFAQSTLTAYGTAKGALASYTRYVAVQYGPKNIRCNGIAPGLIVRPLATARMPESVRGAIRKHITTPRLGEPDDIGHMAAFLASDAAGYINGQIMTVDGGVSARFPHDAELTEIMAGGGY